MKAQLASLRATIQKRKNLEMQLMAECYIAPNGQICTKAQLIAASKELATMTLGLAQGRTNVVVSWLAKDIASRLFGIDIAPLGCAIAEKAPVELCKSSEDAKRLTTEILQFETQIKKMHQECDAIEDAISSYLDSN
jgi:hypothetical protein